MPIRTVEHRSNDDGSRESIHRRWPSSRPLSFGIAVNLLGVRVRDLITLIPEDPISYRLEQCISDDTLLTTAAHLRRAEIEAIDKAQAEAKVAKQDFERPEPKIGMQYGSIDNTTIVTVATPAGLNEIVLDIPRDTASKILEGYSPRRGQ